MPADSGAIEAYLALEGFQNIPRQAFKRGPMRAAFRDAGNVVRRSAAKKIAQRIALTGYPAKRTGRLMKSLKVRVSQPGLLVKVYHEKRMDQKAFYAAYLHYGTSRGVRARKNWIADALHEERTVVQSRLRTALLEALS